MINENGKRWQSNYTVKWELMFYVSDKRVKISPESHSIDIYGQQLSGQWIFFLSLSVNQEPNNLVGKTNEDWEASLWCSNLRNSILWLE